MVSMDEGLRRQSSISSSLRRIRRRNQTTSTGDLNLVENEYVHKEEANDEREVDDNPTSGAGVRRTCTSIGQKTFIFKRCLGSLHCMSILLGVLVSFGSLFSVREILLSAGGLIPALLVWLCAGAMMFVGAQCYAELATSIRKSGGDFIFLYHALPVQMPAFMQVWMGLVMGSGTIISALGKMGGIHLLKLMCAECEDVNRSGRLVNLVAALIICLLIAVHCRSTLVAGWLQVILAGLKLVFFVFIIFLGFWHLATGSASNFYHNMWYPPPPGQTSPMVAFAVASMSYSGWQGLATITEDIKKPEKNIPKTMSFSLIVAIILCVLLNVAYGTLLTPEELLSGQPVIMLIGHKVLGPWARLVHLPILICVLSDMNVVILSVSRMFFSAGREGQSPSLWAMVHVRSQSLTPAVLVMLPIALCLLFVDIQPFLATLGPFQWMTSALVVLTVPIYRLRYPKMERPFKVPLVFPVMYILYCIFLTVLAVYNNAKVLGLVMAIIAPAFPLQIFLVRLKRPRRFLRMVGHVNHFLQKLLLVAPPDVTVTVNL